MCNQKREGLIISSSIQTTLGEPWCPSDLNLPHIYRPPISLTLKLFIYSFVYTLQIKDIHEQQQNRPTSGIHLLPRPFTHVSDKETFPLHSQTMYIPKAQAFFPSDVTKLKTSHTVHSLSLSHSLQQ
jgi:hypothetical protein